MRIHMSSPWWRPTRALVLGALILLAACTSNGDTSAPAAGEAPAPPAVESPAPPDASDDTRSVARRVADAALAAQVQRALLDTAALHPFSFDVTARNSRVALRGSVFTDAQRQLAGRVASHIEGVEQLLNDIVVIDTTRTTPATSSSALQE